MRNMLKLFGLSVGVGALVVGGADAVDNSRAGYNISRLNRNSGATSRSVIQPTLSVMHTGNFTTNTSQGGISNTGVNPGSMGNNDDNNNNNVIEYNIDDCMNDILRCVNGGALPGGLNDLFDADARNMIFSAGGVCVTQIENCMANVIGVDKKPVYRSPIDVWYEFNQRKIQPEYYNFVLRQTGLTPFQAQETCKRLDNEMYGTSFAARGDTDNLSYEYNRGLNAYNKASEKVTTNEFSHKYMNGKGSGTVKNDSVDGKRGYYARWDATQGQCLVRVAAYNNEKLVTNSWLWGAIGDDTPAEVWKKTGDSFKCNKDLFGFALLNQTKTVALVGVGGGTLLGAGIGAATGKSKHSFDCSSAKDRKQLFDSITDADKKILTAYGVDIANELKQDQCTSLVKLYRKYEAITEDLLNCGQKGDGDDFIEVASMLTVPDNADASWYGANILPCYKANAMDGKKCDDVLNNLCQKEDIKTKEACEKALEPYTKITVGSGTNAKPLLQIFSVEVKSGKALCKFKALKTKVDPEDIHCGANEETDENTCFSAAGIKPQVNEIAPVMSHLSMDGQDKDTHGQNAGIGAAVGAAAGGVATAITAFVERSNITCHVGDNLAKVGMGKSYNIESLRDFYVKWGLNLSDLQPTADESVTSAAVWADVCNKYNDDLGTCQMVKVKIPMVRDLTKKSTNLVAGSDVGPVQMIVAKDEKIDSYQTVSSACRVQSGRCVMNTNVSSNYFN